MAFASDFAAGGCIDIAGGIATGTAIAAATDVQLGGEIPGYTIEGVLCYTLPGDSC